MVKSVLVAAAVATACSQACASGAAATKYPIVLAHGLLGFSSIAGVEYFYQIPETLSSNGAKVYVTQASSVNSSVERGEQLLSQIQTIVAATGSGKVNLIGHSQGGLDARYVAAVAPSLLASVTTVGTPHLGSPVADVVAGAPGWVLSIAAEIVDGVGSVIGWLEGFTGGNPQNAYAVLSNLTTTGARNFNAAYPAGLPSTCSGNGALSANGVNFYSWGGTSVATNVLDPSDPFLVLTSLAFSGGANDGLVGQCSNHFGLVIKDNYSFNHLDEVNQVLGLYGLFSPNPVTLFVNQASRLKSAGL